ncbi:SLAM family member 9-like, partial [Clarias magur]
GSEDIREVFGYLGEPVVLNLNVYPTWKPTVIEWSVSQDSVYIATFRRGHLIKFKDQFELNTTTGDLTIKSLKPEDALKYKVVLENMERVKHTIYFQLSVQEKVGKPNITLLVAEKCVIPLKCSTLSNKVSFSWTIHHPVDSNKSVCYDSSKTNRESVMWISLGTNIDVSVTCTATDGNQDVSSTWHGKCPEITEQLQPCNCTPVIPNVPCPEIRFRIGGILIGLILGVLIWIILIIYLKHK